MSATKTQTQTIVQETVEVTAPKKVVKTDEEKQKEKELKKEELERMKELKRDARLSVAVTIACDQAIHRASDQETAQSVKEKTASRLGDLTRYKEKVGKDIEPTNLIVSNDERLHLTSIKEVADRNLSAQISEHLLSKTVKAKTIASNQIYMDRKTMIQLIQIAVAYGLQSEMVSACENCDAAAIVDILKTAISGRQSIQAATDGIVIADRTIPGNILKTMAKNLPPRNDIMFLIQRFISSESDCASDIRNALDGNLLEFIKLFDILRKKGTLKPEECESLVNLVNELEEAEVISSEDAEEVRRAKITPEGFKMSPEEVKAFYGFEAGIAYMERYARRDNPDQSAFLIKLKVVAGAVARAQGLGNGDGSITAFANEITTFAKTDDLGKDIAKKAIAKKDRWISNERICAQATVDKIVTSSGKPLATSIGRNMHPVHTITNPNPADRPAGVFPEPRHVSNKRVISQVVEKCKAIDGGVVSTMENIREAVTGAVQKALPAIRKGLNKRNADAHDEAEARRQKAKKAKEAKKEEEEEVVKPKTSKKAAKVQEEEEEEAVKPTKKGTKAKKEEEDVVMEEEEEEEEEEKEEQSEEEEEEEEEEAPKKKKARKE